MTTRFPSDLSSKTVPDAIESRIEEFFWQGLIDRQTKGGRLVWSFDIAKPATKGVTEILIDAKTGEIASIKNETAKEEAREARADARLHK